MTKQLKPDEVVKLIEAEYDYRDFILQVASNNNWVFDLTEFTNAIVLAKKGVLGRITTNAQELESEGIVIKSPHKKQYTVTSLGIKIHKAGGFKELEPTENSIKESVSPMDSPKAPDAVDTSQINKADLNFERNKNKTENKLLARIFTADKVAAFSAFATAIAVISQAYFAREQLVLQRELLPEKALQKEVPDTLKNKKNDLKSLNLTIDSLNMVIQKLTKK